MNIIVAILLLGFIIIIHELGHFLLAKMNGITVTEFSVGMGPRLASFDRKGTKYSLKLFPFGGSCMMLGEDETIEDDGAFNKKGVWARFSVIFGGAFFNFILAILLALVVISFTGTDRPYLTEVEEGSPADQAGLQQGDIITKVNNRKVNFSREVTLYMYFNPLSDKALNIEYLRDGQKLTTSLQPVEQSAYKLGFSYHGDVGEAKILEVVEGGAFAEAGVKVGDIVEKINGTQVRSGEDFKSYLQEHPLDGTPLSITLLRKQEMIQVEVTPRMVSSYNLGLSYNIYYEKVSPLKIVEGSLHELRYNVYYALDGLGYLISGKASVNEISGPVGIVKVVDQIVDETKEYGIHTVFLTLASFAILISTNLGVINLLPLPALDGGRLVFILIEAIRGKPVAKEREAMVHLVGMALLMALMVFVLFNDIRNILR